MRFKFILNLAIHTPILWINIVSFLSGLSHQLVDFMEDIVLHIA